MAYLLWCTFWLWPDHDNATTKMARKDTRDCTHKYQSNYSMLHFLCLDGYWYFNSKTYKCITLIKINLYCSPTDHTH